jgi:hypothetical protein
MLQAILHTAVVRLLGLVWLILLFPALIVISTPFILLRAGILAFGIGSDSATLFSGVFGGGDEL